MPSRSGKRSAGASSREDGKAADLPRVAFVAFSSLLIARDAAFNLRDVLKTYSPLALLAVKHCERDLDLLERNVDEQTLEAITEVSKKEDARALLAAAKLISQVERIGDLIFSAAQTLSGLQPRLDAEDTADLTEMARITEESLATLHRGFLERDLECASGVFQSDIRLDELKHAVFRRHLEADRQSDTSRTIRILLMVQALERAGDHVKNLAEELFFFTQGRSLRHANPEQRRRGLKMGSGR